MVQTTVSMPPEVKKLLDERAGERPIYKMLLEDFLREPDTITLMNLKFNHYQEQLKGLEAIVEGFKGMNAELVRGMLKLISKLEALGEQIDATEVHITLNDEYHRNNLPIPSKDEMAFQVRRNLDSFNKLGNKGQALVAREMQERTLSKARECGLDELAADIESDIEKMKNIEAQDKKK